LFIFFGRFGEKFNSMVPKMKKKLIIKRGLMGKDGVEWEK
jgi:hypothetical protein